MPLYHQKRLRLEHAIKWSPIQDGYYLVASLLTSSRGALLLCVDRHVLVEVDAHGHEVSDGDCYGLLTGELCESPEEAVRYVMIDGTMRAPAHVGGADGASVRAAEISQLMVTADRAGKLPVGWYRNGTIIGPNPLLEDVALHRALFREPWQTMLLREGPRYGLPGAFMRIEPVELRAYAIPFFEMLPKEHRGAHGRPRTAVGWRNHRAAQEVVPLPEGDARAESRPLAVSLAGEQPPPGLLDQLRSAFSRLAGAGPATEEPLRAEPVAKVARDRRRSLLTVDEIARQEALARLEEANAREADEYPGRGGAEAPGRSVLDLPPDLSPPTHPAPFWTTPGAPSDPAPLTGVGSASAMTLDMPAPPRAAPGAHPTSREPRAEAPQPRAASPEPAPEVQTLPEIEVAPEVAPEPVASTARATVAAPEPEVETADRTVDAERALAPAEVEDAPTSHAGPTVAGPASVTPQVATPLQAELRTATPTAAEIEPSDLAASTPPPVTVKDPPWAASAPPASAPTSGPTPAPAPGRSPTEPPAGLGTWPRSAGNGVPTTADPAMLFPLLPPLPLEEVERRRSVRRRWLAAAFLVLVAVGGAIGDRMTEGRLRPAWARLGWARTAAARSVAPVRKSPDASTVVAESTAVATPGRAGDRQRNEQMSLSAMAKERLLVYSDTLSSALASFEQAFVESSNFQKRKEACARMDSTYLTALRSSMAVAVARRKIVGPLDPVIQRRADDDAERVRMLSIRKSTMCGK